MTNHPNGGASFGPRCDKGRYSHSRPDGCYEFKEPDCIPLPVPVSGSLCKEEPPKAPDGTPLGAAVVACDGTTMQLCLWEKYQGDAQDPQAIAFINRSTFVHEDVHRNDPNLFCITEGDYAGYVGSDQDSEAGYLSDINAYSTQWDYLERVKAQCCTLRCFSEVKRFQDRVLRWRNLDIKSYCKMYTNSSTEIGCSAYSGE